MSVIFFPLYFHLAKVPSTGTNLVLGAVVNPSSVVQHVLLPLVLIVQEHYVLCRDTSNISYH